MEQCMKRGKKEVLGIERDHSSSIAVGKDERT